jgi:hypothetical protein
MISQTLAELAASVSSLDCPWMDRSARSELVRGSGILILRRIAVKLSRIVDRQQSAHLGIPEGADGWQPKFSYAS